VPPDYHLNRIVGVGNRLYIAAEGGQLYRSDDRGASWRVLPSPYEGSFFGLTDDNWTDACYRLLFVDWLRDSEGWSIGSEYGAFAVLIGRTDAGLAAAHRLLVLDPLNSMHHFGLGTSLTFARRYGDAREFAAELRRYLDGEPILAKPPGPLSLL